MPKDANLEIKPVGGVPPLALRDNVAIFVVTSHDRLQMTRISAVGQYLPRVFPGISVFWAHHQTDRKVIEHDLPESTEPLNGFALIIRYQGSTAIVHDTFLDKHKWESVLSSLRQEFRRSRIERRQKREREAEQRAHPGPLFGHMYFEKARSNRYLRIHPLLAIVLTAAFGPLFFLYLGIVELAAATGVLLLFLMDGHSVLSWHFLTAHLGVAILSPLLIRLVLKVRGYNVTTGDEVRGRFRRTSTLWN